MKKTAAAATTATAKPVGPFSDDTDKRLTAWVGGYNNGNLNSLVKDRVDNFLNGINQKSRIYPQTQVMTMAYYSVPDLKRIPYEEAVKQTFTPCTPTSQYNFGPKWSTHWFQLSVTVPQSFMGKEVHLLFDAGCEAMVWAADKPLPLQGFCPTDRPAYIVSKNCQATTYSFYVEMACNDMFGGGGNFWVNTCQLAVLDREFYNLILKFQILREFVEIVDSNRARALNALRVCNDVVNLLDADDRSTYSACVAVMDEFLAKKNGEAAQLVYTIGHCHIDTAWEWPFAESRRKTARSWSAQLRLFENYPNHLFVCSQPQQMAWLQQDYPLLFEQIKQAVADKKFIPEGGAWVEMDTNLPSGESLIRQFVHGIKYTRDTFNITPKVFWLPDSFGYSAQLPQVLNGVGIKYFMTQKLSWNEVNAIPFNSFIWQGLNGARVLTHFPPADTYNSMVDAHSMAYEAASDRSRATAPISLQLYGFGDGGGGPNEKIVSRMELLRDVDGIPKSQPGAPSDFYDKLSAYADSLNVWNGELYFEKHRGTYTTQALIKRGNRKTEFALHDVEALSALAMRTSGFAYPGAKLDSLWKDTLLCQFHDVLPGSCISLVADDAHKIHADTIAACGDLRASAFNALCGADIDKASSVLVFNTAAFQRTEILELPAGASAFDTTNTQPSATGTTLALLSAPPYGYMVQDKAKAPTGSVTIAQQADGSFVIENRFVRAVFASSGLLTEFIDLVNDRVIQPAGETGNVFVLYDDNPNGNDAWDINLQYLQKKKLVPPATSATVLEKGPLRIALQFKYTINNTGSSGSSIVQTVYMYAHSQRLDFDCTVQWAESHRLLKVEFPVNVHNTVATYETQFGMIQRPTHFNTSWDIAKFEVCGHRWADLSEHGYGVSLMTDCKYGYSIHDHMMRLTLLRSPKDPDNTADMGSHAFKFAVFAHAGSIQEAGVVQEALAFNLPLLTKPVNRTSQTMAMYANVSVDALILDTIKQTEAGDGSLMIRLYDAYGGRGNATITLSNLGLAKGSLWKASLTNMLEEVDATATPLEVNSDGTDSLIVGPVPYLPFGVITIVLQPTTAAAAAPACPAAAAAAAPVTAVHAQVPVPRMSPTMANVRGGQNRWVAAGLPVPSWAR